MWMNTIPLDILSNKYSMKITGILHVGAHLCEEINLYEKYVNRNKILWIEALPDKVNEIKQKYRNVLIENAVISDKCEIVQFNRASNGESSSFLKLGLHKDYYPHITYTETFDVETKPLKDIICKYNINFNLLILDVQGVEFKALLGMKDYLMNIEYIYTEVNKANVYENCSMIDDMDKLLEEEGFKRVELEWAYEYNWGNAFYIRTK
jgi:FkbM family methyltransferase